MRSSVDADRGTIIVGGGQAASQCADSLRQFGYAGPIIMFCSEPLPPYQRPPLSKAYLLGDLGPERLLLRSPAYHLEKRIDIKLGSTIAKLDPEARAVTDTRGEVFEYDALVLATGARPRKLSIPGAAAEGVSYLRSLGDVDEIAPRLEAAEKVIVVGAGFIGLEFAAVAAKRGKKVVVLEALDRVMARAATPLLSSFFEDLHRSNGVTIMTGVEIAAINESAPRAYTVETVSGQRLEADLIVVGIGVLPNIELAAEAGLDCDNGIVVDMGGRTSDARVFAAGDCAAYRHPFAGRLIRLESVQNAIDQAKTVASSIAGRPQPYDAVPWFWSDQFDVKLQMTGLSADCDRQVVRGSIEARSFSVFHYAGTTLRSVDSVNRPADHVFGRRALAAGLSPSPDAVCDLTVDLKGLTR